MAESKDNVVTYGLRGLVGKMLVFKRRGDRTFVSSRPSLDKNRIATAAQLAIQEKFKLAIIYAKGAIIDPVLKADYELSATGNQSAFNRAFMDAQAAPEFIGQATTNGYLGVVGDVVSAKVIDDFRVVEVKVVIEADNGDLIEEGNAILSADQVKWNYTTSIANSQVTGTKIIFKAYDLPGNETVLETVIN
ncbi:hypothetical protein [Pedobacter alpinus]|uniref:Uncharacterized protein n=1 Tax=Pedobacter alpinus TaxID=1590643 RepID=A0ABW5TUD4_9SPHI